MKLLYIWNENFGVEELHRTGYNINGKYEINYIEEETKMEIQINKNYVENFWGENISDVFSIVGENGSGKTMLLNYIIEVISCLENKPNIIDLKYIIIFEDEYKKELNIYSTTNYYNMKIDAKCKDLKIKHNVNDNKEFFKKIKIAYFTNALTFNDFKFKKGYNICDFSPGALIRDNFKNALEMKYIELMNSPILNYYNYELKKNIKFIIYGKDKYEEVIPFHIPRSIKISVKTNPLKTYKKNHSMNNRDNVYKDEFRKMGPLLEDMIMNIKKIYKENWTRELIINLIINIFKETAIPVTTGDNKDKEVLSFIEIFKKIIDEDANQTIFDLMKTYLELITNKIENGSILLDDFKNFVNWIEKNNKILLSLSCSTFENVICIDINEKNYNMILELLEHYEKTNFEFPYFSFDFGLSSGEYNFLNIFSNLFSMFDKKTSNITKNYSTSTLKCKDILLLFDEADLSLHPIWQQKFLYWLLNFVSSMFNGYNVQIILTTHSPIMLSDFPRNNVIYMGKNSEGIELNGKREIDTFANHIHTLFLDSFFLNKEGTIGCFAEKKINEVISKLNSTESSDESDDFNKDILNTINYIGDDLIRKKLIELYNEKFNNSDKVLKKYTDSSTINATIKLLKNQIKQLEYTIQQLENNK